MDNQDTQIKKFFREWLDLNVDERPNKEVWGFVILMIFLIILLLIVPE